jgi:4'-phosphopantetheinyl transferase EntD
MSGPARCGMLGTAAEARSPGASHTTRPTLMERLVPSAVAAVETRRELTGAALFYAERRSLGRAAEGRRREFATGRACARAALQQLGHPPAAIPAGARGEPLWPPGLAGSITHCRRYRACALARSSDVIALGIDAHLNAPLPERVLRRIAAGRERERAALSNHQASGSRAPSAYGAPACEERVCLDKLLFCVKEAVYKAWFALAKRPLSFADVEVSMEPAPGGAVRALLPAPAAVIDGEEVRELHGRWGLEDGLLGVAVVLARHPRKAPL